jgi:hypothetical protein
MPTRYVKISKDEFYRLGAFANSDLFRRERDGEWQYFRMY